MLARMKKFKFNLFLIFACFLVLVAGLMVVMVIAPGADVLGLKYIRSTSGSIDSLASFNCQSELGGEVVVNCDNIDTYVKFVQNYNFSVNLIDQFNGYARSDEEPKVVMERADGVSTFKVNDYRPFIYHNRLDGSGLYINVPIYFTGKVTVVSNKSKVIVTGLTGALGELNITTLGKVVVEDNIKLQTLNLNVGSKSVNISNLAKIEGNLTVVSKNANITVLPEVSGDIVVESKGGSLKFNTCNNLTVKADSLEIKSSTDTIARVNTTANIVTNDDVILEVLGSANIETKKGKITLGDSAKTYLGEISIVTQSGDVIMLGSYSNNVSCSTKRGDITATYLANTTIDTIYGEIYISKVDNATIAGGSNDIVVEECTSKIEAQSRGGDIVLGAKEKYFNGNANVKTLSGDVTLYNVKGSTYNITTSSGDVNFDGAKDNSSQVNIESTKGYIKATNFGGSTYIKSEGKIYCSILTSATSTEILGKNNDVTIANKSTCSCDLTSSKANNIWVDGEKITSEDGAKDAIYKTEQSNGRSLKVTTIKGKIILNNK